MYLVNLRSGWKLSWIILFSIMLVVGWAITPAQAHCKGKHTGDHAHCTGGEDPPPAEFNPEIVWRDGSRSIVIANGDGSNPTTILSDGRKTGNIMSVSWSPGGKEILLARWEGEQGPGGVYRLPIFDANGQFSVGSPTLVVPSDATWFLKSRWSPVPAPDGNHWIAYTDVVDPGTGETSEEVFLFNPDTDTTIQLTETEEDFLGFTWSHDATRIAVHTTPGNVENEDIKIYSLTADLLNGVMEPEDPVSLLLHNDNIKSGSYAAMLKQIAVDPTALQDLDWANTSDRLIVNSDGGLWIVPVPKADPVLGVDPQQAVANDTVLVLGDTEVLRLWPSWSPDDKALIYRRVVDTGGGTCSLPNPSRTGIRLHEQVTFLVIGMLDNPDIENVDNDPPGLDDPDKIECDVRPDDETVFDLDGMSPEWWRGLCGNGIVAGTEQCDDGNKVDGDGCSAVCVLEP